MRLRLVLDSQAPTGPAAAPGPGSLTPLAPVQRATTLQPGDATRQEIWYAESAATIPGTDRPLWTYERQEEPGTPWIVTYSPTGQVEDFGSLRDARRWTGSPAAVEYLRQEAVRRCDATQLARIQVAILNGQVLPAGVDPDSRCVCGGYLATRNGRWVHVNACPDCWTPPGRWGTCPTRWVGHLVCRDPEAVR